jgi:hypothetical protein
VLDVGGKANQFRIHGLGLEFLCGNAVIAAVLLTVWDQRVGEQEAHPIAEGV